jgi:hypothetical protein
MRTAQRVFVASASLALLIAPAAATGQSRADNVSRVRARAQRAQAQFESYRRRLLPVTSGHSASTNCDVRIGRFCYWHDDSDDLPREPKAVAVARDALLRSLDSLDALSRDDEWMVGQRVRYLVEADRAADALRAATECSAAAWWCAALRGFSAHALGDYEAADRDFEAALARMPPAQRCRWTDLSDLLPDASRKSYRKVPCERRDSVNAHIWWLADPRWGLGGNDLRTEVYARLTMSQLVQQARSAHDMSWGNDMAELMLRYGWPAAWSRASPSSVDPTQVSVIGHEPSPSFDFLPEAGALSDPFNAEASSWTPTAEKPLTRYAPKYARRFAELRPQVAWFARGDSAAIVAAYEVGALHDTVFTHDSVEAAVVLSRGPGDIAIAREKTPRWGVFVLPTRSIPALVSVEVVDSAGMALARSRFATQPPADPALSDVLLFDGAGGIPETFDAASARALGTLTVNRQSPFGLYWELYGDLARTDSVTYAISVERRGASWLRRLAERTRLADRPQPVRVGFDERPGGGGVSARSLLVDVSTIPAGEYRLTLTVRSGERTLSRMREIDVR